ncbi:glycosyl hydrolase family 18 protein [Streptomyces sp. NPDC090126]|uniref:glycosyl hydrolase family 18 protein n=1 Tax=Streptomyces sp. NPDC090126 TaxID=3365952 RepID=UPI00382EE133
MSSTAHRYAVYYESWADPWVSDPAEGSLSNLPAYVGTVILAYMQPDARYTKGSLSFQGTGIQFSSDPAVVRDAVAVLRQRNPGVEVLVGIGGATYNNWSGLNVAAIADFVSDFGLDGVNVDYEPTDPGCVPSEYGYTCRTDREYVEVVGALSNGLPAGTTLSVSVFHVGAYGEGQWANAQPISAYTGVALALLRSEVAEKITRLNIMSYDASTAYDPLAALAAYQHCFKGPILLGVEVAPEAWPQQGAPNAHVITLPEVEKLANGVKAQGGGGMFLWSMFKQAQGGTPTSNEISKQICVTLDLGDCDKPLVHGTQM